MLLPGGIIIWVFSQYCPNVCYNIKLLSTDTKIVYSIVIFSLVYIVGIGNHIISSKIWGFFRNNPDLLYISLNRAKSQFIKTPNLDNLYKKKIPNNRKFFVFQDFIQYSFSTIIGIIVLGVSVDIIFSIPSVGYTSIILVVFFIFLWLSITMLWKNRYSDDDKAITESYYEAYYYIQQISKNKDISVNGESSSVPTIHAFTYSSIDNIALGSKMFLSFMLFNNTTCFIPYLYRYFSYRL